MKTINFNPNGGPLTAKAVFKGNMVANYEIFLREKNSNAQTSLLKGDNTNPDDDKIDLPTPVANNDGRKAVLETGFYDRILQTVRLMKFVLKYTRMETCLVLIMMLEHLQEKDNIR